jgi:calcium binding protein 39
LPLGAGYEHQEIALNCGTMLRECVRFEALAKIVLHSEHFFHFFKYVEVSTFDIASDAFATFKELLTRHKMLAADFLEANYDQVEICSIIFGPQIVDIFKKLLNGSITLRY